MHNSIVQTSDSYSNGNGNGAAASAADHEQRRADARMWLTQYNIAVAENERRERQVAALYELWRSVPHTETERLLQRVTERAIAALDGHTCSLLLRDRYGDTMRVAASVGLPQDVAESVEVIVGERIAGRVAASGQPILVNKDPRSHPLLNDGGTDGKPASDIARRPEVESALCTPLIGGTEGEVLGVLCLSRFAPATPFTEGDLRILSLFAAQAGAAVAQTRTIEDLTRAARDAAEMEREIARHQSLVALGQMAATVAHELRNPLSSIKGAAQFLLRECVVTDAEGNDATDARTQMICDFLTIVVDEVDGLGRLTNDMLNFARPTTPRLAPTHLAEMVACEVAFLRSELSAIGVNEVCVQYEGAAQADDALLPADRAQIGRSLRNLLLNAAQAAAAHHGTAGQPQIVVRVAVPPDPDADWSISVIDNGPGVPDNLRDKLCEPFFTTKARGTGLGLAQVRQVIESHGGRIEIAPPDPIRGGACFTLFLPSGRKEN